jgi:hypothetical protein
LARFFERFTGELAEQKVDLPKGDLPDDEYFRGLSKLLLSPEGLPGELCEALFTIDEMSNEAGQERLQNAVAQSKVELKFELESSHGDMAMQGLACETGVVRGNAQCATVAALVFV